MPGEEPQGVQDDDEGAPLVQDHGDTQRNDAKPRGDQEQDDDAEGDDEVLADDARAGPAPQRAEVRRSCECGIEAG